VKKIIKFSIYIFIAFIVLITGVVFAFKMMYPPEKLKKIAASKAEQYLKRQINFENISIGFSGLKMEGFAMSERPAFDKGTMLKTGHISMMPKILPLLFGKIIISKVKIKDTNLSLIRYKDGSFNFSDFMAAAGPETPKKIKEKKKGKTIDIVIAKLIVDNAEITCKDYLLSSQTKISSLDLRGKNVSLNDKFTATTDFTADYDSAQIHARIPLKASFTANLSKPAEKMIQVKYLEISKASSTDKKSNFTLTDLNLSTKNASLTKPFEVFASFTSKYKMHKEISADIVSKLLIEPKGLKWQKAKAKIISLTAKAGGIKTNVQGEVSNLINPKADLKITVSPFNLSELSSYVKNLNYNLPIPKTAIAAKFNTSDKMVTVNSFKIKPGQSNITGNGILLKKGTNWTLFKGAVSFALKLADVADASAGKLDVGGELSGKAAARQVGSTMKYSGDMTLSDIKAIYNKNTLSNLNGRIKIANNEIRTGNITGKLNGSDFKTSLLASLMNTKNKLKLDTSIDTLYLEPLLPDVNPAKKQKAETKKSSKSKYQKVKPLDLDMQIKVNKIMHPNFTGNDANVYCNLTKITPKFDRAGGTSSFAIKNGQINDLSEIVKRHNMAKAFLLPIFALQKAGRQLNLNFLPDFDNISYSIIEGNYKFTNGYMQIVKSEMISTAADITASGSANFKTDTLNMKIKTKIKTGSQLPVNFTVTGSISDPKVRYDIIGTLTEKAGIKSPLEEGKKFLESLF
jgi:hypothetical protein